LEVSIPAFLIELETGFNFCAYLFTVYVDIFDAPPNLFAEFGVVLTAVTPDPFGTVYLTIAGLLVSLVV
jgi:hypothetical protein